MLLRRLIFAIINWLLAASLTVFVVLLIGVVIAVLDINTEPFKISLFPFWLFVFLIAMFDSSILGNGFLGGRLTGIRVKSTQDKLLSLIGTFVRASIVILVTTLLVSPLLSSSMYESGFHQATFLERPYWITFATLALLIPCSLIYTNGRIGIHDLLLGIRLISINVIPSRKTYPHSKLIVLVALMAFGTSVVAHSILTETGLIKYAKWEMQTLVPMIEGNIAYAKIPKNSKSTEALDNLHTYLQSLGYRVSYIGYHYQSDNLTHGLPNKSIFVVTNDIFMSVSRIKSLSIAVRSKLITMGEVDSREPLLVQLTRRASFATMMVERKDGYIVFRGISELVLTGYATDMTSALCCGPVELYLNGK